MKYKFYWYSIIVVFILSVFSLTSVVYAQNEEEHYISTITITGIGLELTKQALLTNDYDSAEKYSALTNNFYGKNIQFSRAFNSDFSDEIHIQLLDLHSGILSKSESPSLINQINQLQKTLTLIPSGGNSSTIIASILSEADEQYQIAIQDDNSESYFLTLSLIEHSKIILEQNPLSDNRLNQELDSFFHDLNEFVSNKRDFVVVGNLITAIQRDLVQTETITINKTNLYDTIQNLYSELLIAVNSGDYSTAE